MSQESPHSDKYIRQGNPTIRLIITRAMDKISKFIIHKSVKSKEVIYSTATGCEVRGAYFGKTYTLALGLTQSLIQWVPGSIPKGKAERAWCLPLTSIYRRD